MAFFLERESYSLRILITQFSLQTQQIWQNTQVYIVSDDIELGISNKLPLWIFDFLN